MIDPAKRLDDLRAERSLPWRKRERTLLAVDRDIAMITAHAIAEHLQETRDKAELYHPHTSKRAA